MPRVKRGGTRGVRANGKPEAEPARLLDGLDASSPLVAEVAQFIRRYVVLTDAQLLVIALWVIHTYGIEHVWQTPYLAITSPDSECGKSRLMEVLEMTTARGWLVEMPSDAVLYRQIDLTTPTLLLDEVDAIFNPQSARFHEGKRAILNSGHRRGNKIPRASDFGKGLDEFDPFCAKALAGIGSLPDTIARRSIYVRMARRGPGQKIEPFIVRDAQPVAAAMAERIDAWAEQHAEAIGKARPKMPAELSDRMQEGCESLVAIADLVGCGRQARAALVELMTGDRLDMQETMRMRLLRDLRGVWLGRERRRGKHIPGISTQTLTAELRATEEAPWDGYYGHGLDANDMANLLKHYGVRSRNVKVKVNGKDKVLKGYRRDDLYPVWERYLR